jgi:hypothetical protein
MSPGEALYSRWCDRVQSNSLTGYRPRAWRWITDAEKAAWEAIA